VIRQRILTIVSVLAALLVSAPATLAAFPGRNGMIAFSRTKGASHLFDIWVMDPSTGKEVDVTNTPAIAEAQVAFAPDGRTIAFAWGSTPYDPTTFVGAGIGVIQSNGAGRKQVVTAGAGQSTDEPAWTADGKTILFRRTDGDGSSSVWAVDAASGAQRQLTVGPTDSSPLGSPDGRRIAYFHQVPFVYPAPNPPSQELIADANGANPVAAGPNKISDWSPDGLRFAYFFDSGYLHSISTSAIDGSDAHQLADLSGRDDDPAFSPDGQLVVWRNKGTGDLWTIASGGGQPRNLTHQTGDEFDPSWGSAAAADTTPPAGKLTGKSRQKLANVVTVTVGCDEVCTARASGTVTLKKPSQSYRLPGASPQPVAAGGTTALSLRVPNKTGSALRKALKHHRKAQARLKIVVTDIAGNARALARTLTLRL